MPNSVAIGIGVGLGGEVGASNPIPASAPKLWFDASTLELSDGTAVDTWTDSSGNGYDATATLTTRPLLKTNIVNGKNVVRFDGSNDYMTCGNAYAWGTDLTFVVVFKFNAVVNFQQIISKSTGGAGGMELRRNVGNDLLQFTDNVASTISGTANLDAFHIHVCQFNNTTFSNGYFKDGATNNGSNTFAAPMSDKSTSILLGARNVGTPALFANMDLAEIVVYDRVITTTERDAIEVYLGSKYGITVA